jgi:hypothetical protein
LPSEVFLHLAADAGDWCGASRADPMPLEGLRERFLPERFLPEITFRGRRNTKFQHAVLAAAALHGGTGSDLLDEVAWWQTDDFWQYALFAAVANIRAAASRAGVPVRQACQDLAQTPCNRGRQAVREPAHRDLSTLRPDALPSRPGPHRLTPSLNQAALCVAGEALIVSCNDAG